MAKSELVVGLDIGTTKICAAVAEVSGDEQVEILGLGSAASTGIRKGVVVDIPATAAAIRDAVAIASQQTGVHIATVYVGITGEHIASLNSRGGVNVSQEIQEEHVQQARQAARQVVLPQDREIIHNITRHFIVDGQPGVRHPVGMAAARLEVETHVVTAASSFVENVAKCVQRANLDIEDVVVEPLATGLAVLTDAERQLGVALADIGGGTTDVALFVDGAITHTTILSIGGNHVTNDMVMAFRLPPEDAERLKVTRGAAQVEDVDPNEYVEIHMIGDAEPREIPQRLLPEIIGPRMEDLLHLLRKHLEKAAADGINVSTCVLSGGGSQLPGLTDLAQQVLQIPVRVGRPRDVIDPQGLVDSPIYATAVGLLHYAAERVADRSAAPRDPRSLSSAALSLVSEWMRRFRGQ